MQSGAIASSLRAVSSNVSPLLTLEVETLMLMASAERRLAAISNDVRVRVDDSKKRLMTVRARSAGTFLTSRFETSRNDSAVSSRCVISLASSSRIPSRCLRLKVIFQLPFIQLLIQLPLFNVRLEASVARRFNVKESFDLLHPAPAGNARL